MAVFNQRRRPTLLPALLVLGVLGLLARPAFLPGPMGSRTTSVTNSAGLAAGAAVVSVLAAASAGAVVDNPLAHGAPGVMESSLVQDFAEKGAFGGLLASTVLAWWRATVGGGSQEQSDSKPPAFWAMVFANLSLVILLSNRWYESGHFPLANMYESLSFLAWGVTAVNLYFVVSQSEQSEDTKILTAAGSGSQKAKEATADIATVWASPCALGIVAFATLSLPKALQKSQALVPALQSNWLVMHVSVVMCSYATLMFGSVLCMAVLALSAPKDSPINALREAVQPVLQGIANILRPQPVLATSPQVSTEDFSTSAMTGTLSMDAGNTAAVAQPSFGSVGSSSVTIEFAQSATGSAKLSQDDQLALTLDDLAYRSCLLGFGFLTVGIISGAVWANEAWGNYWSWDPKETWALIVWLIYAGYLHTRLQLGWDTRDSAKVGAFGFIVVWICYIGVNLMGIGLHSYGFFLK
ncbi:unnamed protein product [Polarella glacialis]|uniref:Cytochrome c assembly protein domain-containing protein n=2 Tax=Polarella glacialis TaxID=89957 RepID=A0A813EHK8_POLGL|nr:unnamed protein product [Polarella glacialis]CAE8617712.1 unnamed protein product [Polarella glacialis]